MRYFTVILVLVGFKFALLPLLAPALNILGP
jgi:hypothetical protein